MEMTPHPRLTLLGKLQGRVYAEVLQLFQRPAPYTPHVGEFEEFESLPALLLRVYQAHPLVALVLLGKLGPHLGQCLAGGYAHTDGDVGPEADALTHLTHELHQVMVCLVAMQVAEGLIDGVVLHMQDRPAQDACHPPAHGGIELHVGGEDLHAVAVDDVLHLEDRVTAVQSHGLGFRGECHDAAIVVRENTDGFAFQSGMEYLFHGTEE